MPRTTPKSLGEQIKRLRQQRGLSQSALAEAAGLKGRGYVAKIEGGERVSPSMPVLERIAKALGVKLRVTLSK
jgi:transcriptional regulator with XRE-family HTH domain